MRAVIRTSLVFALSALAVNACGDESTEPVAPAPAVTSAAMTRVTPPRLQRVCASAVRKSTIRVRCPALIPDLLTDASVLLPRRSVVRPGSDGDDGRRRFRGPRDFYQQMSIRVFAGATKQAQLGSWTLRYGCVLDEGVRAPFPQPDKPPLTITGGTNRFKIGTNGAFTIDVSSTSDDHLNIYEIRGALVVGDAAVRISSRPYKPSSDRDGTRARFCGGQSSEPGTLTKGG